MKKLNIKITEIKTGEELLNENANCILAGIADDDGICNVISVVEGEAYSILCALGALEKAKQKTLEDEEVAKMFALKKAIDELLESEEMK
ncbi:MAG: hypothetical protein ACI4IK_01485 [Eubacterium sp.]